MIWSRPDEIALQICKNGYCLVTDTDTLNLASGASLGMGWKYLIVPIIFGIILGFVIGYYIRRKKNEY